MHILFILFYLKSTENPALRKWSGDSTVYLLDLDYSKYMLLFNCKLIYFGLKTVESVALISRKTDIEQQIIDKANDLLSSFDYGGEKTAYNLIANSI